MDQEPKRQEPEICHPGPKPSLGVVCLRSAGNDVPEKTSPVQGEN